MNTIVNNNWQKIIDEEKQKEYFKKLEDIVDTEYRDHTVNPPKDDIFNAFRLTPLSDVKAVILGQDPYHRPGQAHGLSFSVQPSVTVPRSLQNIFKELHEDTSVPIPETGCLVSWARQGVLLLNTILTVREGEPLSHAGIGWETFTNRVIQVLNAQEQPMVFLLWGNSAKEKASLLTNPGHLILQAAHPSPFSARRGFLGCRHFSKTNEYLVQHGVKSIDWAL